MIVNKSILGLHIIFHEAHGLLAGKIANEIACDYRPPNWFETLIAVCEHDDRQLNFHEKDYLSDIGIPLDFTEDKSSIQEVIIRMDRILKSSKNKSQWVRLLISYHLEFIYSDLVDNSKRIQSYFKKEEKARRSILKFYKTTDQKARTYYEFLRFCDRLSLILCKDEAPEAERLLEINTSINGQTFFIKKSKNGELIINPWIFNSTEFELSIEERLIKVTQFSTSTEFEFIVLSTKPQIKKWQFIKSI